MDKWKERICEVIDSIEINVLDVYFQLVSECIKGTTNPEERFQYIIEAVQGKTFSEKEESLYISESIINNKTDQYIEELVDYIRMLSERNYTADEFYSILYKHVFDGELYPKETSMQSYLLYLLAERTPGIPYYQTKNLLKLSDKEYKSIVDRIQPQIEKSIAMLNRHFKSKTEEASQLYYISQDITSDDERIVYWSVVMSIIRAVSRERARGEESKED